jgi:hypothetical protein
MEWIARERNVELRLNPEKILPGVKTIMKEKLRKTL